MEIVEQDNEIISVGQLNRQAKALLESELGNVSVVGEISNLAKPSSGHLYFTLKDEDGSVRCAMFKNQNLRLNFKPKDGHQCIINGQVSLYTPRGDYQLIVKSMQPYGAGNLMQQFEKLKNKLADEGLFDANLKKQIPRSPQHVAVITSESTAALQDLLSTIDRRAPFTNLTIVPATVQGDTAPRSLIQALRNIQDFNNINKNNKFDLIILCRGGGSIEDLWAFNNEDLARKIFAIDLPVISGVGHEIDFTIADFVSDLRAETPTAAAEIATDFLSSLNDSFELNKNRLNKAFYANQQSINHTLELLADRLKSPKTIIKEQSQAVDSLEIRIGLSFKNIFKSKLQHLSVLSSDFKRSHFHERIKQRKSDLVQAYKSIGRVSKQIINNATKSLQSLDSALQGVSPLSILDRGYSILMDKTNTTIKDPKTVKNKQTLKAKVAKGEFKVIVKK